MSFEIENVTTGSERVPVEGLSPVIASAQSEIDKRLAEHLPPTQNLGRTILGKLIGNKYEPALATKDLQYAREISAKLHSIVEAGRFVLGEAADNGFNLHFISPKGNSFQDEVLSMYEFDELVHVTLSKGPEMKEVPLRDRVHMSGVSTKFFHLTAGGQLFHAGSIPPDRKPTETNQPISLADREDEFPIRKPKSIWLDERLAHFQTVAGKASESGELQTAYFEPLYSVPKLWQID